MNEENFKLYKKSLYKYVDELTESQLIEMEAFFNWYIHLKYTIPLGKKLEKIKPIAKPNTLKYCKCKAKDFKKDVLK